MLSSFTRSDGAGDAAEEGARDTDGDGFFLETDEDGGLLGLEEGGAFFGLGEGVALFDEGGAFFGGTFFLPIILSSLAQ